MSEQDWAKEPWEILTEYDHHFDPPQAENIGVLVDCDENKVATIDRLGVKCVDLGIATPETANRIVACVNACQGVPTECLERVEQGKSSVIVADEVLNGQRAHFVMPDSTKT